MYAERLILETDETGQLMAVPKLPGKSRFEAIFLRLDEPALPSKPAQRRTPHPDLAGGAVELGNVIDTAPSTDWNLPA